MIRKRIIFYGRVQGVGFRYNAKYAANLYGCTGWARNEYDGSVTMEIQGSEAQIDKVIFAVDSGMFIEIERMESKIIPLEPDEKGFRAY